jgi:hypothetical protein
LQLHRLRECIHRTLICLFLIPKFSILRQQLWRAMEETAVYELQQLCTGGGLTQDSLSRLIDAGLSVPSLVRSDAAAMAQAKKAGLGMAERQALKEALRQHRDEVRSPPTTWNARVHSPAQGCTACQHF